VSFIETMFEIISASVDKTLMIVGEFGYFGVFLLSLLDRVTVFLIPAEIVLPAFGILVSRGEFSFWLVMLWVCVGSFIGNLILYYVFLKGGRIFLENYGRYFLISKHDLEHLGRWFAKYGNKLVLIGYIVPTSVRSLVPIIAGVSKMNAGRFSLYTLIGFLPLNFLYVLVGMKAEENFEQLIRNFERFNYVAIFIIAVLAGWYIYRHLTRRHLTH